MGVSNHRNVPSKNKANTQKVIDAIRLEVGTSCKVVDGLKLMQESGLKVGDTLKRVNVPGTLGCLGAASNDNIHLCGEAAQEFARKVCSEISQ
jgi:hypothetical protein